MAKQLIIAVMEEVVGEYVLNISKENLKIAALRGKIKLDNVQLDGELIGSHVLGAVGLSGFGVLSCWAKSVRIVVPWTNLVKEPTRIEIRGIHLICVPLLPSTAHKMYGAGTAVDPRCTLRTRAKRSALARLERNYFSGRMAGEGPPSRRIRVAVKEVSRELRRSNKKKKNATTPTNSSNNNEPEDEETNTTVDETFDFTDLDSLYNDLQEGNTNNLGASNSVNPDLPELPRDWKVKLREKVMRNMEASMRDLHIRCEVADRGLDFSTPNNGARKDAKNNDRNQDVDGGTPADQRSFSFGVTVESLVARTASETWDVGSTSKPGKSSRDTSKGDHLGPNPYVAHNNKIVALHNMSIYWDDDPPLLISESFLLRSNEQVISANKLHGKISTAMDALRFTQHPGEAIVSNLAPAEPSSPVRRGFNTALNEEDYSKPHQYICELFSGQVRVRQSDRTLPGPLSCMIEFLPVTFDFDFRPHQYLQYQKLRSAMLSQRRFDTMLRQRPTQSPKENPRAWWKYAISCVTSRPNSRPWEDVLLISRSRPRYIDLVKKKILRSSEGNGFHGGLSEQESDELLALEGLLPIEALLAFHLVALRQVYQMQKSLTDPGTGDIVKSKANRDVPRPKSRSRPGFGRFRFLGANQKTRGVLEDSSDSEFEDHLVGSTVLLPPERTDSKRSDVSTMSLLEAMTLRLGTKKWFIHFKLDDASVRARLLHADDHSPILQLYARGGGTVRSFGPGKRDFSFDLTEFEVADCRQQVSHIYPDEMGRLLFFSTDMVDSYQLGQPEDTAWDTSIHRFNAFGSTPSNGRRELGPHFDIFSNFQDLPPSGVLCCVAAAKDVLSMNLSLSAHPATLVWSKPCMDAVADFFNIPSTKMQTELTRHLRNVATPLARKAQLAILSPPTLAIHINVAAPKVWFPVSASQTEGAVFLDAGRFRMSCTKNEDQTDAHWDLSANDIKVNFFREKNNRASPSSEMSRAYHVSSAAERNESAITSVIRPFHVRLISGIRENVAINFALQGADGVAKPSRSHRASNCDFVKSLDISISPICLNLVDAEVLARAIGKWYAQGLGQVRRRRAEALHSSASVTPPPPPNNRSVAKAVREDDDVPLHLNTARSITVALDKVEMALEGHSKWVNPAIDDRSHASQESTQDYSPPTRTYVVEVFSVGVQWFKFVDATTTKFVVGDASIIQIRDPTQYSPLKGRHAASESQHSILVRKPCTANYYPDDGAQAFDHFDYGLNSSVRHSDMAAVTPRSCLSHHERTGIIKASLLHDSKEHLDEVDVEIDSIVVRVTPTTLKDCAKGLQKVVELAQLVTREMERKVHEEGRKARLRDLRALESGTMGFDANVGRLGNPFDSTTLSDVGHDQPETNLATKTLSDSSFLFKVKLKESTLLAGRPTLLVGKRNNSPARDRRESFAVIQVVSNILIMFQSIENPDASGTKTLHVSVDNLAASVNANFEQTASTEVSPMIGPTGVEFRIVYTTENQGCVVSHDISIDCEALKACVTPDDMFVFVNVSGKMLERMRAFGFQSRENYSNLPGNPSMIPQRQGHPRSLGSSWIRYQKKGTGVATRIRVEVQTLAFVLLRAYRSKYGATEFLDFNVKTFKGKLEGCMSALSGECSGRLSVNFFNSDAADWEYVVEPFDVTLSIDQMPNELLFDLSSVDSLQLNVTGVFLKELAEADFQVFRRGRVQDTGNELNKGVVVHPISPSILSNVGLRRATEMHSILLHNHTGLDLYISPNTPQGSQVLRIVVADGGSASLDPVVRIGEYQKNSDRLALARQAVTLGLAPGGAAQVGDREPIVGLHVASPSGASVTLHRLEPAVSLDVLNNSGPRFWKSGGRSSPETVSSENSQSEYAYYHAEPVVEWCMQNQRLRSSVADLYSLQKGRDLLSSSVWSPEDEINDDSIDLTQFQGQEAPVESSGADLVNAVDTQRVTSPDRRSKPLSSRAPHRSNWLRPYLKNDSPEWTDMTCILRMARERVMLPDSNWMWLNDWTVDLDGDFGESTDADGWEYEADFETFRTTRRFYRRGDLCRRRRWTRTRMVKPPRLDDPYRQMSVVWETARDEHGNYSVQVRSHVTLRNETASILTFFAFSPSWDEDKKIATLAPGEKFHVPVFLASAAYLRLARKRSAQETSLIQDFVTTERLLILPTSFTSSVFLRTSMNLEDVSDTVLHFLVNVNSLKGVIDVVVHPVIRLVNLLPCQLECQLGEVLGPSDTRVPDTRRTIGNSGKKIAKTETMKVASGKEGKALAVSPSSKPHISLRVPGYRWSPWQRIVNRKSNSHTWRPLDSEEEIYIIPNKGDADFADEFKSVIRFERLKKGGDPLILIMSVECGHCPTVRIYSQYWILDKTGFGSRFCEGFADLLGTTPDPETCRRSHLLVDEARDPDIQRDMEIEGHPWSIGMSGMCLFFSRREKIALSIESGAGDGRYFKGVHSIKSKWIAPMDISNVMPKTVLSVEEQGGPRRFELAISVTVCPDIFARTKLISFLPRYQVVNLLRRELVIAQEGCLKAETVIPSQSAVPFHWERSSLPSKVRLGAPTSDQTANGDYNACWTNGSIQLDKVGITSIRLPTENAMKPMVVQAEVRLATKGQSSAVVVVIWSANEKSNPLYLLRNRTSSTILCRQPLQDEGADFEEKVIGTNPFETCTGGNFNAARPHPGFECGTIVRSFLGLDRIEEFVWVLHPGDVACFGFDDPEKPHILEWTSVDRGSPSFKKGGKNAFLEVDAMGSSSVIAKRDGREIRCQIAAEHSTKVIEFVERTIESIGAGIPIALRQRGAQYQALLTADKKQARSAKGYEDVPDEDEDVALSFRLAVPAVTISVIDNAVPFVHGREILLAYLDNIFFCFSQSREGYHEIELKLMSFQVDNHVLKSFHPVLIFCPRLNDYDPFLHLSAVRRLQPLSSTYVFRYAAIRVLELEVFLDRRTAETIARFIEPLGISKEEVNDDPHIWVLQLTSSMGRKFAKPDRRAPRDIEKVIHTANSGRIYFEQLHLHPVRLALTFTQEWMEWNPTESMMVFQFIRGMASIAGAPLMFTSFVVGHVFESPQALLRVISAHYSSQLTKQIYPILGSLAILATPADFISNVGTGVRDFFYEPIQGAVHGPRQFIEGLEAGTQSLARGVFVGVVRGAANVTEVVNSNLAGLTADDDFIDERKAHQRMLTDAMSRGVTNRTLKDSLALAGASVSRSFRSGAMGFVQQPTKYASKYGPIGFVKGVGKAVVGAIVKPVVGVGDAAVLVLNHVSDATSDKQVLPKIPKRLRRALPIRLVEKPHCVRLVPYDERAAKAQKIVTGGESVDDVYLGHVNIASHLVIASDQCLWAIDRRSREPWCVSWEEISHFSMVKGGAMRITVFSQTGLKSYLFQVDDSADMMELYKLLSMQLGKMGNCTGNLSEMGNEPYNALFKDGLESLSNYQIPGIKTKQTSYVFGSCNKTRKRLNNGTKDEIDLIEQCFLRVKQMGSDSPTFFKTLDEEAWTLINCWGQVFSGLSSRRCIAASIINGTGNDIQIKSTKLMEGGSPCYSLPTREYDAEQGILHAGGAIIFFGWGLVPNLLQAGNVFMQIETNAFVSNLSDQQIRATRADALPGYQVSFLEKSYDESGWWAKYWLLVRKD